MFFSPSRKAFFAEAFGEDSIEVSEELHNQLMDKLGEGFTLDADAEGQPIAVAPALAEPTLDELYQQRVTTLSLDFEKAAQALRGAYPQAEAITWALQLSEAQLYDAWVKAGKDEETKPSTPYLNVLNAERTANNVGQGMDDLVQAVLTNNEAFAPEMARITALRQAAYQSLTEGWAAKDAEAIKAVPWTFDKV